MLRDCEGVAETPTLSHPIPRGLRLEPARHRAGVEVHAAPAAEPAERHLSPAGAKRARALACAAGQSGKRRDRDRHLDVGRPRRRLRGVGRTDRGDQASRSGGPDPSRRHDSAGGAKGKPNTGRLRTYVPVNRPFIGAGPPAAANKVARRGIRERVRPGEKTSLNFVPQCCRSNDFFRP